MTAPVADGVSQGDQSALVRIYHGPGRRWWHAVLLAAFWLLAVPLLAAVPAQAEEQRALKGIALVIGETDYKNLRGLDNPDNDAREIKRVLDRLGFDARDVVNRDSRTLKRDLDRFIEDAAGADVALLYYSGHGIEAGGENWLIPVDADVSSLDEAGTRLISLSAYVQKLQQSARYTIILLDACRSSPFPQGAGLRVSSSDSPKPISAQGLGAGAKGVTVIEPEGLPSAQGDVATVLGFAAAPGDVALDGPKDGNSPYAAGLLKHLSAPGLDFGDVMTLVAQEVYVETNGRQVPWTNHNLRQFLYFGAAAETQGSDEALISGERRKLLLSIAATPQDRKRMVETLAQGDHVPLAALYGMLKLLEIDGPQDPGDLDQQLRAGSEKLKSFLAERQALRNPDEELKRLSALADAAVEQGAIKAAIAFHEKAKARIAVLARAVDQAKEEVKARELDFAQVFVASARTNILAFDHLKAAEDLAAAYEKAKTWDAKLSFTIKLGEADALRTHGDTKGDNAALRRAIDTYVQALGLAPREQAPLDWATVENNLGLALARLGAREPGTTRLTEALSHYRAALEERTRVRTPDDWAETQNNLGSALFHLAKREAGTARLDEAIEAFQAALEVTTRARLPIDWAVIQNNLGGAFEMLGERGEPARLHEALATHRAAAEELTRERMPLLWAKTQEDIGNALQTLAWNESGSDRLDEAVSAYEAALQEVTRQHMPIAWARIHNNLANVLATLGEREGDPQQLEAAVQSYRNAFAEWTRARAPLDWAMAQNNLGTVLETLGKNETGTKRLEEALSAYRAALGEMTEARVPRDFAMATQNLGTTLLAIGTRTGSRARIEEARAALQAAWKVYRANGEYGFDTFYAAKMAEIEKALGKLAPAAASDN